MDKHRHYEALVRRYLEDKASQDEVELVLYLVKRGELRPWFEDADGKTMRAEDCDDHTAKKID